MKREEAKVTLFILGNTSHKHGHYLAKAIQSQNGVVRSYYENLSNTIKVYYDQEKITINNIERLSSFGNCTLISNKHDVEKQVWFLQTQKTLKALFQTGGIISIIIASYLIICGIKEFPVSYFGYASQLLALLMSFITYYLYKRIKERRITEQNNLEMKYTELEKIGFY